MDEGTYTLLVRVRDAILAPFGAAGGTPEEQVSEAEERVAAFVEDLDANRETRLREAGFSERIVQEISDSRETARAPRA